MAVHTKFRKRKALYTFWFHYNKQKDMMSVHFRDKCIIVKDVICNRECFSKWNERQPHIVMKGLAKDVIVKNGKAYIE